MLEILFVTLKFKELKKLFQSFCVAVNYNIVLLKIEMIFI